MAEEMIKEAEVTTEEVVATAEKTDKKQNRKPFDKNKKGERKPRREESDGIDKVIISSHFVVKVTKGGRTRKMATLVVAGDRKGRVGIGSGKSADPTISTEKATVNAKKNMIKVNLVDGTIPHEVVGKFGTSKVVMFPAPAGTGVIAGGGARNLLELCGVKNITCKSFGSRNSINNIKAAMDALKNLHSVEAIAAKRGKKPEEI